MERKQYTIVVGNEKGGAGKTTTTIHLIISLLDLGFKVSSIDVDCRQQSLTRYLDNRKKYSIKHDVSLKMPNHFIARLSDNLNIEERNKEEDRYFNQIFEEAKKDSDFIIIDTPGSNLHISTYAHSFADMIITPINDSFMDLDVLAHVNAETINPDKPSIYSQTIWEQKLNRAKRDNKEISWIVIRNRLSHLDAINKRNMAEALKKLSQRVGFKVANGFGERVIFRELFLQGLTLLDVVDNDNFNLNMSHIAARQELRDFLRSININSINQALELTCQEN